MTEEWRRITSFLNYEVSNLGRVRRATTKRGTREGKVLKSHKDEGGYLRIRLQGNSSRPTLSVSRLVAKAFIPNPKKLPEVNHKDGHKKNNDVKNLEWRTTQGNRSHAAHNGLTRGSGICFYKRLKKWCVRISVAPNKRLMVGCFNTKAQAILVRNKKLKSLKECL